MSGGWLDGASAPWPAAAPPRPVVLPFGAFEQHGPHLPLSTDTTMAAALGRRIAAAVGGLLLPAVPFGASAGNDGFPGTISLAASTVAAVALDVCRAATRQGHPALVVVNGDFGNRAPLRDAAAAASAEDLVPCLVVDYPGLDAAAAEVCRTEPAAPGFYHADELETSVMLVLAPDTVCMADAVAEYPPVPPEGPPGPLHLLSRSGVFGDPRAASAATGWSLLDRLADGAIGEVRQWLAANGLAPDPRP